MTGDFTLLAAETVYRTSTAEEVTFWILAVLAVLGAVAVVAAPKAVYSAIFLAIAMIILAVLYIAQGALFLGIVQVVVYTGAVMMLFLFVLMLIGVDSADSLVETIRGQRVAAIVAGARVRHPADRRHRQRLRRRFHRARARPTAAATSKVLRR